MEVEGGVTREANPGQEAGGRGEGGRGEGGPPSSRNRRRHNNNHGRGGRGGGGRGGKQDRGGDDKGRSQAPIVKPPPPPPPPPTEAQKLRAAVRELLVKGGPEVAAKVAEAVKGHNPVDLRVSGREESLTLEAARLGHVDALKVLEGAGLGLHETNNRGISPLIMAAYCLQVEVVEMLLSSASDASVTAGTFGHGTTVLIAVLKGAARVSDLTKVTTLVKRLVALEGCGQALLNTCDKKGRSPLHHAAASGHPELVTLLCSLLPLAKVLHDADLQGLTTLQAAEAFWLYSTHLPPAPLVSDTKKGALKHANSGDASEQTVDPRQQRVIDEVIAELADLEENGPTPAARGGRGGRGRGPWVGGRGGQRRRQESSEDSSESSEEDEGTECWEGGHRRRRDHLPQGLADARKYVGQWDVVPPPPQHGNRNQRGRNQRRPYNDELPDESRAYVPSKLWGVLQALVAAIGLRRALVGRGALRHSSTKSSLMGACGLDAVVRTLFEESPTQGPSKKADRADEMEDRDELLHEMVNMRKHAFQRNGRGNDAAMTTWRLAMAPKPNSKAPNGGLSEESMVHIIQYFTSKEVRASDLHAWSLILHEALQLHLLPCPPPPKDEEEKRDAKAPRGTSSVDSGDAKARLTLLLDPNLWTAVFKRISTVGRMLCYCLLGQMEGNNGEALTLREEMTFDGLLELLLRVWVSVLLSSRGSEDGVGLVQSQWAQLGTPHLAPLIRALEDALQVLEGSVEEPSRFATLLRGCLVHCLWTSPAPLGSSTHGGLSRALRILSHECAPLHPDGTPKKTQTSSRRGRGGASPRGPPPNALRALTAVVGEENPPHTRNTHTKAVVEMPLVFSRLMLGLKDGVNRVVMGLPAALHVPLSMLLRIPGVVASRQKLEYAMEQLEARGQHSINLSLNRFMDNRLEHLDMVVQQLAAAPRHRLRQGSLSINFVSEPGVGEGPVREFLDAMTSLFHPNFPHNLIAAEQGGGSSKPVVPSTFRDAASFPLFAKATSGGDALAVVPVAGPPKPPTPTVAVGEEGKEGQEAVQSPTDKDAETKGGEGAGTGGRKRKGRDKEEHKGLKDGGSMDRLVFFQLAGRLLGLSVRHGTPLGVVLPPAVWSLLQGRTPTWQDYCGDDHTFKASMQKILEHDFSTAEGAELELTFTVTEQGSQSMVEVELCEGGASKKVDNENKASFVQLAAQRRMIRGADDEIKAMAKGLEDVIPDKLLLIFTPTELGEIVSGPRLVDVNELRRHMVYERGLKPSHPTVQSFWEVVEHDLDEVQKRQLLLFWSGSSTAPALGFESDPEEDWQWTLAKLTGPGVGPSSLPEASTCDRRLSLPDYPTLPQLREKLITAITFGCMGYDRV